MSIGYKVAQEASDQFWEDYHEAVEKLGFHMAKRNFIYGEDEVVLLPGISPRYSEEQGEEIRKILGYSYEYKGYEYKVGLSPSMDIIREDWSI
jgi:hypothetical protein